MPDEKREFMNYGGPWVIYDTVIVCDNFFGSEASVKGWFTSLLGFAQNESHTFFKLRTEGQAGAAYNNQQSADSMDYSFELHSIGLAFIAPGSRDLSLYNTTDDPMVAVGTNFAAAHWWEVELPNHCGVQFKVNQDIIAEGPAYDFAPGYGPQGGGGASCWSSRNLMRQGASLYAGTQGAPNYKNRHEFVPPIKIQRTGLIEGTVYVSDMARSIMGQYLHPNPRQLGYLFQDENPDHDCITGKFVPARFMIQMSLLGKRLVQQRGSYHI